MFLTPHRIIAPTGATRREARPTVPRSSGHRSRSRGRRRAKRAPVIPVTVTIRTQSNARRPASALARVPPGTRSRSRESAASTCLIDGIKDDHAGEKKGQARLLLVESDPDVRELVTERLEHADV